MSPPASSKPLRPIHPEIGAPARKKQSVVLVSKGMKATGSPLARAGRLPRHPRGVPVHVVMKTEAGRSLFADGELAREIFAVVERSAATVAACLMPDHLHWVQRDAAGTEREVRRFKLLSTNVTWRHGLGGRLWQRSYWGHVLRREEDLLAIIAYVMFQPVRSGFVTDPAAYPYAVWRR